MATEVTTTFAALAGAEFLVLTTYRGSGEAVPTTVWFAEVEAVLVLTTHRTAGKLKRIRNNPHVTVAPSDARGNVSGPAAHGMARELEGAAAQTAEEALSRKYGEQWQRVAGGNRTSSTYIEVRPDTDAAGEK